MTRRETTTHCFPETKGQKRKGKQMEEDNGGKKNNNNNLAARINLLKVQKYVNLKENVIQPAKYFVPSCSLFVAM